MDTFKTTLRSNFTQINLSYGR